MTPINIHDNVIDPDRTEEGYFPPDASNTDYILLQTAHSLSYAEKLELQGRSVTVQSVIDETDGKPTYLCKYQASDLSNLEALSFVDRALVYHNDFVVHPRLRVDDLTDPASGVKTKSSGSSEDGPLCEVKIVLHDDTPQTGNHVFEELRRRLPSNSGLKFVSSSRASLEVWVPAESIPTIAAMDHVMAIYPSIDDEPHTIVADGIVGLPTPFTTTTRQVRTGVRYEGEGQVVAVCDTGLDTAQWTSGIGSIHPGFLGFDSTGNRISRIKNTSVQSVLPTPTGNLTVGLFDHNGHGTHVAGIVLGAYSAGTAPGVDTTSCAVGSAPEAGVFVQKFKEKTVRHGSFEDRVTEFLAADHLNSLNPRSRSSIAIQNNSWGASFNTVTRASYLYANGGNDVDYETFSGNVTYGNKPILIVRSAGNDGEQLFNWTPPATATVPAPAAQPLNRQIGAYAAAKNGLTVGVSWSGRDMQASKNRTVRYVETMCIEGLWAYSPLRLLSGHQTANSIVSWSNKGPATEGWLKPDVVAPGAGILSTFSRGYWAQYWQKSSKLLGNGCPYPNLTYMSGTSQAAPLVSGLAACIREAIVKTPGAKKQIPLAQTIKAIIVNGAVSCQGGAFWFKSPTNQYVQGVLGAPPDCIQGHGRVDYNRSLRHVSGVPRVYGTTYSLSPSSGYFQMVRGIAQGTTKILSIGLGPNTNFYCTLVYWDARSNLIQYVMDLSVQLQAYDTTTHVSRNMGAPRAPNTVNLYPMYAAQGYTIGTDAAGIPIPSVPLGNTKKVSWPTVDLTGFAATEIPVMQVTMTGTAFPGMTRPQFSLAWLSE